MWIAAVSPGEVLEHAEPGTVRLDLKDRAIAVSASFVCGPEECSPLHEQASHRGATVRAIELMECGITGPISPQAKDGSAARWGAAAPRCAIQCPPGTNHPSESPLFIPREVPFKHRELTPVCTQSVHRAALAQTAVDRSSIKCPF